MSKNENMPSRTGKTFSRFLIGAAIVAAFTVGFLIRGNGSPALVESGAEHEAHDQATVWTCSMHPQIKLPKAGQCPLCFMDLIPLDTDTDEDLGPRSLVLSETAAALAEIQTAVAERTFVESRIRLIGKVDYDESRVRVISAWVAGRIDTLFVDFTGTAVAKGERLVSLYSPELYAAQSELLNAIEADLELRNSDSRLMRDTSVATVAAARERLKLWGMTTGQIDQIVTGKKAMDHVEITSPLGGIVVHKDAMEGRYVQTGTKLYTVADLSRVWVTLNAYESDLVWLKEGQSIDFSVKALPGKQFTGDIIFIDPVLSTRTRTAQVRIVVNNQDGLLKPGLFVNATARAGYTNTDSSHGSHGSNGSHDADLAPLVIPATAALVTGDRAVVYVRLPDTEKPTFEGREIILGPRVGDYYVVNSGLMAGEIVVTKGNFKLDSALQIQAKPSMMNPAGGGPAPVHNHGGESPAGTRDNHDAHDTNDSQKSMDHSAPDVVLEVSEEFKLQLGGVLTSYLEVQVAMSEDNDADARAAARRATAALANVDMGLVTGEAHHKWMDDSVQLEKTFAVLETAPDLNARRLALLPATDALWTSLRRFGYSNDEPVRRFHCPMANSGSGADWLQMPSTTANPYYGASMLRCGSQVDSLSTHASMESR